MSRSSTLLLIVAAAATCLALLFAGDPALARLDSTRPARLTEPPRQPELRRAPGPRPEPAGREESEYLTRVGAWPYGPSHAVDVDPFRQLIFLGSGGAVLVLDESDPTNPQLLSDEIRTLGLVQDVFYDRTRQLLFIAAGEGGLEIWDLADPLAPEQLSVTEVLYFEVETPVGNVDVYGNIAVVECSWGYVHSLNVADPVHPVHLGFNGTMGNPAYDLHVSQKDAQAHTTGPEGMQRLAIQPNGVLLGSGGKDFVYGAGAVFGTEDVSYVGYSGSLYLVDLMAGGWPFWSALPLGGVGDIVVQGQYAYTINGDGLSIIDVHNYSSPFRTSILPVPLYLKRLQVQGSRAYVVSGGAGLTIADVSDALDPAILGRYDVPSVPWQCIVAGRYAFVAHDDDGFLVIDVGDLQHMELVAQLDTPGEARDMVQKGNRIYLADWSGGVRVIDVSVPTAPVELGSFEGFDAWRIAADGDYAYAIEVVVNEEAWLHVLDVSDPTQIVELIQLETGEFPWTMIHYGDHLYLGQENEPMLIVDVSDPTAPFAAGTYPLTDVLQMRERDGILFATSQSVFDPPLVILDLADPLHPAQIGQYGNFWVSAFNFDLSGDYLYFGDFDDLAMLDISDLSSPVLLDEHRLPDSIFQITASGNHVFVCNADAGLQVVENPFIEPTPVAGELPMRRFLDQNRPNPFNPSTEIAFGLPAASRVTLAIFDANGKRVTELLAAERLAAGRHVATWNGLDAAGRRVPSGMYVYRLSTDDFVESRKMVLVK